jgi:hypothetical protein
LFVAFAFILLYFWLITVTVARKKDMNKSLVESFKLGIMKFRGSFSLFLMSIALPVLFCWLLIASLFNAALFFVVVFFILFGLSISFSRTLFFSLKI